MFAQPEVAAPRPVAARHHPLQPLQLPAAPAPAQAKLGCRHDDECKLLLPRAVLFEAALRSGSDFSASALARLTAAQVSFDSAAAFTPDARRSDLTVACACFFLRASHHLGQRGAFKSQHHHFDSAISSALAALTAAVRARRFARSCPTTDLLESDDTLALALLYNLARKHDFGRQPTPRLKTIVEKNLTFAAKSSLEYRAHRESGFVRGALAMGRAPAVSLDRLVGDLVSLDSPVQDEDGKGKEKEDDRSAHETTLAADPSSDIQGHLERTETVLQAIAERFGTSLQAIAAVIPPQLRERTCGALDAALVAAAVTGSPAERETLDLPAARAPVVSKLALEAGAISSIIVGAFDEGDDAAAADHVAALARVVGTLLNKLKLSGSSTIALPLPLPQILRVAYASSATFSTANLPLLLVACAAWHLV